MHLKEYINLFFYWLVEHPRDSIPLSLTLNSPCSFNLVTDICNTSDKGATEMWGEQRTSFIRAVQVSQSVPSITLF